MLALGRRKSQRMIIHNNNVCERVVIEHQGYDRTGVHLWIAITDTFYLTVHLGLHDRFRLPVSVRIDGAQTLYWIEIILVKIGGERQDSRIGIEAPPFLTISREELLFADCKSADCKSAATASPGTPTNLATANTGVGEAVPADNSEMAVAS